MNSPSSRLKAPIYKYFEIKDLATRIFTCNFCKHDISAPTTSNLIKHYELDDHIEEFEKYKQETSISTSSKIKRVRTDNEASNSPTRPITTIASQFSHIPRYGPTSIMQKERTTDLIHFLIKCMLPISLIISKGFVVFMSKIDPYFNVPSITTVKRKIRGINLNLTEKIKTVLKSVSHVNISIDIWSDATMRSFVGYMVQGINDQWELVTCTLDFKNIKKRHTGDHIKEAYDDICYEKSFLLFI
jgi:hypothetical protein